MEKQDRRRYPRDKGLFHVECITVGGTLGRRGATLGGGGLFLEDSLPIQPGGELTVRFRPAKHLPVIETKVRVLYDLPGKGTAIEFTEISPEDRQKILHLVVRRAVENRQYPRIKFVTQVEHESGTSLGLSKDISVGGIFVTSSDPLPEGSQVKLRFHMDDGGPIIEALAEVRFVVEKVGMGLRFLNLSPRDRHRVAARVGSQENAQAPSK